jgi:hypothetical protein
VTQVLRNLKSGKKKKNREMGWPVESVLRRPLALSDHSGSFTLRSSFPVIFTGGYDMNGNTISDIINEPEKITFSQLLTILGKIKIKILLSMLSVFLVYSVFLFSVACYFQGSQTAIALTRPFDMALKSDKDGEIRMEKLYLVAESGPPPLDNDSISLQIKRMNDPLDIEVVGRIIAQRTKMVSLPKFALSFDYIQLAYGQEAFQWYGHERNYRFREEMINKNTVKRIYDDGWILEYQANDQGRSIPSSFRWIKKG